MSVREKRAWDRVEHVMDITDLVADKVGAYKLDMGGQINMGTNKITNLGAPTSDTDAATRGYVDSTYSTFAYLAPCHAASTANENPALLIPTAVLDSIVLAVGHRVLLTAQTTLTDNGIYVVQAAGPALKIVAPNPDAPVDGEVVFIKDAVPGPNANGGTGWLFTDAAAGEIQRFATVAPEISKSDTSVKIVGEAGTGRVDTTVDGTLVMRSTKLYTQIGTGTPGVDATGVYIQDLTGDGSDEVRLSVLGQDMVRVWGAGAGGYTRIKSGTTKCELSTTSATLQVGDTSVVLTDTGADGSIALRTDGGLRATVSATGVQMSSPLDMQSNAITALPTPTINSHAATKLYVDNKASIAVPGHDTSFTLTDTGANGEAILTVDGAQRIKVSTATGCLMGTGVDMNGNSLSNLPAPGTAASAATKQYVDDKVSLVVPGQNTSLTLADTGVGLGLATLVVDGLNKFEVSATQSRMSWNTSNYIFADSAQISMVASGGTRFYANASQAVLQHGSSYMTIPNNAVISFITDNATRWVVGTTATARHESMLPIDMNSNKITELADPTGVLDAANKQYADRVGVACRYASTVNVNVATCNNGDTFDGVNILATGDRVLLLAQTTAADNGVYVVGATEGSTTRIALVVGSIVSVAAGSSSGLSWVCINPATGLLRPTYEYTTPVCRAASTANVDIATLNHLDSVDGVGVITGDKVLLLNQTTASQNGVYTIGATEGSTTKDVIPNGAVASILQGATYALYTFWQLSSTTGKWRGTPGTVSST